MDHPCERCRLTVEDGTPFCPGCGAPQIRVVLPRLAATEPVPVGTPDDIQAPSQPVPPPMPSSHLGSVPGQRNPLGWASDPLGDLRTGMAVRRNMNRAAMTAGILTGLASLVPFVPWILLVMVAGGGIAVTIYHRRMPASPVPPSQGFRIGLLSGFFGWTTVGVINALLLLPAGNRALLHRQLADKVAEAVRNAPDQATREIMQKLGDTMSTGSGLGSVLILGLIVAGALFLLLGGLGGAIGASIFGNSPHKD